MPAMPIFNEKGGVLDLTNGTIDEGYLSQDVRKFSIGLTKREYFAAMAMQGLITLKGSDCMNSDVTAKQCVRMANALLLELKK